MRWSALVSCLVLAACATQQPPAVRSSKPASGEAATDASPAPGAATVLPAGLCGFAAYLSQPCENIPPARFALVLHEGQGVDEQAAAALTRSVAEGSTLGLPVGYPFVVSYDDLPRADGRRGLAVVAGLFTERSHAEAFAARVVGASIVELATVDGGHSPCAGSEDYSKCEASTYTAVQMQRRAPAYAKADLEALEQRLNDLPWVPLGQAFERRRKALEQLTPVCIIEAGAVSITDQDNLYGFSRTYAPARCAEGEAAWVTWNATRLESVVTTTNGRVQTHQVVLVECDSPTLEVRPLGDALDSSRILLAGSCGG
ncbi:MAG: hypothetical protein R3B13_16375 [Polyangiaceae bacterium]